MEIYPFINVLLPGEIINFILAIHDKPYHEANYTSNQDIVAINYLYLVLLNCVPIIRGNYAESLANLTICIYLVNPLNRTWVNIKFYKLYDLNI